MTPLCFSSNLKVLDRNAVYLVLHKHRIATQRSVQFFFMLKNLFTRIVSQQSNTASSIRKEFNDRSIFHISSNIQQKTSRMFSSLSEEFNLPLRVNLALDACTHTYTHSIWSQTRNIYVVGFLSFMIFHFWPTLNVVTLTFSWPIFSGSPISTVPLWKTRNRFCFPSTDASTAMVFFRVAEREYAPRSRARLFRSIHETFFSISIPTISRVV